MKMFNITGSAISTQYALVRSDGNDSCFTLAQADTAAHAAGLLGVLMSQSVPNLFPALVMPLSAAVPMQFTGVPTIGRTAYLSNTTAGFAQDTAPPATGSNQIIPLGTIVKAIGTVGVVAPNPGALAALAALGGSAITALTGDVTATGPGSSAATIANGAVTNAKRANMAASTLSGNATGSPAAPTDLTAAAVKALLAISFSDIAGTVLAAQFPALTGDVTTPGGSFASTLANLPQTVLLARTALLTASLSVNAQNIINLRDPVNPQDAATKAFVLAQFSGGVPLVDGNKTDITVSGSGATWLINALAVTFAKMQNIATQTLIGRQTAGTGSPESIGVTGGVEFDGSGNIRVGAFTGDVLKSAGSAGTAIATGAVTNAKLANMAAGTLKGNATGSPAAPTDLTAAAVKTLLAISFADVTGTLQAAQFPALTGDVTTPGGSLATTLAATGVTAATYGDASHVGQVTVDAKGRVTAASSPSISITAGAVSGLSTVQTGALTGDVTKPAGSGTTTLANIPNDTPMAGDLLAAEMVEPATPSAGTGRIYEDSTGLVLCIKNKNGFVTHTAQTQAAPTHFFFRSLGANGSFGVVQPAVSDLQATGAFTTLANPTGGPAVPIEASVAQMRAMLGIKDTWDLSVSFGLGDGTGPDSILPNGTFFTSPFWVLPTTRNSDIPASAFPYGGNPTYIDANISHPAAVTEFPVCATFIGATLEIYCAAISITPSSGSPVFTLTMSKNGACDSSPISLSKSSVGSNTMGSIVSLGAFSVASGDRVGLRFTSNSVNNSDTVKFTATLRLFN